MYGFLVIGFLVTMCQQVDVLKVQTMRQQVDMFKVQTMISSIQVVIPTHFSS
jgi:hypothetical protein